MVGDSTLPRLIYAGCSKKKSSKNEAYERPLLRAPCMRSLHLKLHDVVESFALTRSRWLQRKIFSRRLAKIWHHLDPWCIFSCKIYCRDQVQRCMWKLTCIGDDGGHRRWSMLDQVIHNIGRWSRVLGHQFGSCQLLLHTQTGPYRPRLCQQVSKMQVPSSMSAKQVGFFPLAAWF